MGSGDRNIFVRFEYRASPLCPFDPLPSPNLKKINAVLIAPRLMALTLRRLRRACVPWADLSPRLRPAQHTRDIPQQLQLLGADQRLLVTKPASHVHKVLIGLVWLALLRLIEFALNCIQRVLNVFDLCIQGLYTHVSLMYGLQHGVG